MDVMHGLATKCFMVFYRSLTTGGKRSTVAMAVVEMMIDVAVKTIRSMEPGTDADENPASEPFWAVIAVGRAVIGWGFVISVWANGRGADLDANAHLGVSHEKAHANRQQGKGCQYLHSYL
jgi:hypothetical protein